MAKQTPETDSHSSRDGADADDLWLEHSSEKSPAKPLEDIMQIAYFINDPVSYNCMREADDVPVISVDNLLTTINQLSVAEREELVDLVRDLRQSRLSAKSAEDNIRDTAPFLLAGILPEKFMERLNSLNGREGSNFAILINQSGCSTVEEATEYLSEQSGIQLGTSRGIPYGILHRFLGIPNFYLDDSHPSAKFNRSYLEGAINRGYYGDSNIGRFVVYAPLDPSVEAHAEMSWPGAFKPEITQNLTRNIDAATGMPTSSSEDVETEEIEVVETRYLFCFIDAAGGVWVNQNYLLSDEPDFAPEH